MIPQLKAKLEEAEKNNLSMEYRALLFGYIKGYRINENGEVFGVRNKFLKQHKNSSGYLGFTIHYMGKTRSIRTHKFQALVKYNFCESIYSGVNLCVRHLDGNELNNRIENIEIGTYKQNAQDISPEDRTKRALKLHRNMSKEGKERIRKKTSETAKKYWTENKEEMIRKIKQRVPKNKGEKHPRAILTDADVIKIRSMWPEKSSSEIAKMFGLHTDHCKSIINRRGWKHL